MKTLAGCAKQLAQSVSSKAKARDPMYVYLAYRLAARSATHAEPRGSWSGFRVRILEIVDYHEEGVMAVTAIHPGEQVAEELKELGMSAAELARKLDVPTSRITGILNGQRAITGDTALRLAHFFGTSAEFWLNLQSLYELRIAERKGGKSFKTLPRLRHPERVPA